MSRLSVVHAIARLNVGGAALSVLELAAEQRRRGHIVSVVAGTLAAGEESMEYVAHDLGVPVVHLPALQRELSLRGRTRPPFADCDGRSGDRHPDITAHAYSEAGAIGRSGCAGWPSAAARPAHRPHVPRPRPLGATSARAGNRLFIESSDGSPGGRVRSWPSATRSATIWSRSAWRRREKIAVIPYGFDLSDL